MTSSGTRRICRDEMSWRVVLWFVVRVGRVGGYGFRLAPFLSASSWSRYAAR